MKTKHLWRGLDAAINIKSTLLGCLTVLAAFFAISAMATGPYAVSDWPPTIDTSKIVHYGVVSNGVADTLTSTNANWTNILGICAIGAGADQGAIRVGCLGPEGFTGLKAGYTYFNIADTNYAFWANEPTLDILMLVYGDTGVLNANNASLAKGVKFQEGTSASGYSTYVSGALQLFSTNAYNNQWSWILFTVTNAWWTNKNDNLGYRQVGTVKPGSSASSAVNGGINGGTIRMQCGDTSAGMAGWTIHAFAIGQQGAFGTTNDINLFAPFRELNCPPVPAANLVGIDFNAGTSNNLVAVTNVDAQLEVRTGQGPGNDQRTAAVPILNAAGTLTSWLYNFGVVSNYLGYPCQNNAAWHICVEFYDDPAFVDAFPPVQFGPEAYATDGQGCSAASVYSSANLATLTGTGKWIRRSWIVPNVNLFGVNLQSIGYTGGPRLISKFGQVAVSRVDMAILRTGTDPLAGQDPLAGCPLDPQVCDGVYTNFVELDLPSNTRNGLDIGTPGADQNFITETAGPATDQRASVRADTNLSNYYLQFQITGGALGSNYQDNAHLAIAITYYDDPILKSNRFGIDAWHYRTSGGLDTIFASDNSKWIMLEGTDKWREAYWEIDRLTFNGVNQAPQAAVRFKCEAGVHVCRVRYAVIRTCGPNAGVNWLNQYCVTSLNAAPDTNGLVRLSWPYGEPQLTVQGAAPDRSAWSTFAPMPVLPESEKATVRLNPTNSAQLFRLYRPSIP